MRPPISMLDKDHALSSIGLPIGHGSGDQKREGGQASSDCTCDAARPEEVVGRCAFTAKQAWA